MELQGKLVTGVFRARPNRFLALVDIEENITVLCFVPNPGRVILLSSAFIHLLPKIVDTNSLEKASFGEISIRPFDRLNPQNQRKRENAHKSF